MLHRSRVPALAGLALLSLAALRPEPAAAQSLRGSRTSVNRMYYHAVDNGYYFYKTSSGVRKAISDGRFARLSSNADYAVTGMSFPYVTAETRLFVERLARQYRAACGERLVVTSGIRPKSVRLANSVDKSVHPTGMAVDLRKPRGRCLTWLRRTLLALEKEKVLEATEEYTPPHFHVAVFPRPYERYAKAQGGAVLASRDAKPAASAAGDRYRVRRGDSLWTIARRHDVSVGELKSANKLRSARLSIGQVLVIPGSR
jgi:hypothetical protein